jgi:NDP-sugar pyrophosphorylase family protein
MNIIVPMAGMGKRMRPHTLTVPKPLIQLAGKSIVQRLVEDIVAVCDEPIEEIGFIIGHFGEAVEQKGESIIKKKPWVLPMQFYVLKQVCKGRQLSLLQIPYSKPILKYPTNKTAFSG